MKIFAEERKAGAAPCTSQEFPLLVGTPWEAWRPGPPAPEQRWVHLSKPHLTSAIPSKNSPLL